MSLKFFIHNIRTTFALAYSHIGCYDVPSYAFHGSMREKRTRVA